MHIRSIDKLRVDFVNTIENQILAREERIRVIQTTFDEIYKDLTENYKKNVGKLNTIYKTIMDPEVQTVNELRAMLDWDGTNADRRTEG